MSGPEDDFDVDLPDALAVTGARAAAKGASARQRSVRNAICGCCLDLSRVHSKFQGVDTCRSCWNKVTAMHDQMRKKGGGVDEVANDKRLMQDDLSAWRRLHSNLFADASQDTGGRTSSLPSRTLHTIEHRFESRGALANHVMHFEARPLERL